MLPRYPHCPVPYSGHYDDVIIHASLIDLTFTFYFTSSFLHTIVRTRLLFCHPHFSHKDTFHSFATRVFVFASLLNSSSNIAMTPFRHLPFGRALLLLCVPLCSIGKIHVTLGSFLSFSLWRSYISPLCFFKLLGFPIPVTSPSIEASISPQCVRDSSPTRIRNRPSPRRRQTKRWENEIPVAPRQRVRARTIPPRTVIRTTRIHLLMRGSTRFLISDLCS